MIPLHIRTVAPDPQDALDELEDTCGVCHNEVADCYCCEEINKEFDDELIR